MCIYIGVKRWVPARVAMATINKLDKRHGRLQLWAISAKALSSEILHSTFPLIAEWDMENGESSARRCGVKEFRLSSTALNFCGRCETSLRTTYHVRNTTFEESVQLLSSRVISVCGAAIRKYYQEH